MLRWVSSSQIIACVAKIECSVHYKNNPKRYQITSIPLTVVCFIAITPVKEHICCIDVVL